MDGSGDHHIKWNKPGSERQILHILFYRQNPDNERRHMKTEGEG
jgi:hypothetical protein